MLPINVKRHHNLRFAPQGFYNAALARALPELAPPTMAICSGPSIKQIPLYNQDVMDTSVPPAVTLLADAMRVAAGVIIVSPEYNCRYPVR